jgi:hypothetical protein
MCEIQDGRQPSQKSKILVNCGGLIMFCNDYGLLLYVFEIRESYFEGFVEFRYFVFQKWPFYTNIGCEGALLDFSKIIFQMLFFWT